MEHRFLDVSDGMFYASRKGVHRNGVFFAVCRIHHFFRHLFYTGTLQCGNFYHRASQLSGQLFRVKLIAPLVDDIHHVHCDYHRNSQLQQLSGQVQIPFKIRTVDNIKNRVRPLLNQIVSGYHFLQRIRRKGINSRQVDNMYFFASF